MTLLILGSIFLIGCSVSPEKKTPVATIQQESEKSVLPVIESDNFLLEIRSPSILKELESSHGWEKILPWGSTSPDTPARPSTHWLSKNHLGYQRLSQHLQTRIEAITTGINRDLVVEHKEALAYPQGNVGRRFDPRWFDTEIAFFQLVGVVNRIDQLDFYQIDDSNNCGEVRFIYRLAYQTTDGNSSRLPLTFSVVYDNPTGNCSAVARAWAQQKESNQSTLDWLRTEPLNLEKLRFS